MSFHLPSFILGAISVPVLIAVLLVAYRTLTALTTGSSLTKRKTGAGGPAGFEPLRFTPRLMGQLRRPLETDEDHARAS
jgi:hypothetical protein